MKYHYLKKIFFTIRPSKLQMFQKQSVANIIKQLPKKYFYDYNIKYTIIYHEYIYLL